MIPNYVYYSSDGNFDKDSNILDNGFIFDVHNNNWVMYIDNI